jgi:hypothetical protein
MRKKESNMICMVLMFLKWEEVVEEEEWVKDLEVLDLMMISLIWEEVWEEVWEEWEEDLEAFLVEETILDSEILHLKEQRIYLKRHLVVKVLVNLVVDIIIIKIKVISINRKKVNKVIIKIEEEEEMIHLVVWVWV